MENDIRLSALKRADDLLAQMNARPPLTPPAAARLREELKIETTYDSNAIEGSTLTLRETVIVLKDAVTVGNGIPLRDIDAARGFARGFDAVFELAAKRQSINVGTIKALHNFVQLGALPEFCGRFRDHNVRILGTNAKPADYRDVPFKVEELAAWVNGAQAHALHPIERAALFHARFETIHPFADGNGRTGRLLLNFMLIQNGWWPVNIRYREDRSRYYDALAAFNETGCADDLTVLIAERAAAQLELCIRVADPQENAKRLGLG